MSLPGRDFVPWCAPSPAGAGSHARGAEGGGPHHHPGHGADWPSAVAVAVPGPMAGPGLQLVPPCMGIILLNPSERHRWMRLEPPSGSPISPGAESSAGGGTAAILGREASVPPATCPLLLGPQPSQHCSCTRAEGQQNPGGSAPDQCPGPGGVWGAGGGSAPNTLPLQMQQEPVGVIWDAAPPWQALGQETGASFGEVTWRVPLDKLWLLSPSGAPHSLAQRAGTQGFCQDPAPWWGG